ncbi:MAG: hypothetical protein DMG92_07575 [Acidobacteria bacterium]|nr:MAG: hypothetical protein DMG92_07575 [Acidobacteriota bacterium]
MVASPRAHAAETRFRFCRRRRLHRNSSNLLQVDPALPLGPSASTGRAFGPGGPPGVFVPPPLGGGGGSSGGPGGGGGGGGGNPPPATPEPGTIVLVISGAGIIFARYRRR